MRFSHVEILGFLDKDLELLRLCESSKATAKKEAEIARLEELALDKQIYIN